MREITKCQGQDPGAVPGASNNSTTENSSGNQAVTEQRSVETAKRLPQVGDMVEWTPDGGVSWRLARVWRVCGPTVDRTARATFNVEGGPGVFTDHDSAMWRWPEVDRRMLVLPPACKSCGVGLKDSDPKGASEGLCFPCGNRPAYATRRTEEPLAEGVVAVVLPFRTCQVPGCDTILGEGSAETMCAPHRAQRERAGKCARKGCTRSPLPSSVFCSGHQACAASATLDNVPAVGERPALEEAFGNHDGGDFGDDIPEEEEQPNDRQSPSPPESPLLSRVLMESYARLLMVEAFEFAWEKMAEDPGNDPVTVARCKMVRDYQLQVLGVLP